MEGIIEVMIPECEDLKEVFMKNTTSCPDGVCPGGH